MNLKTLTKEILNDLSNIIIQFNQEDFIQPLELLSGSSVGQHIRHIVDFYSCILKAEKTTIVCYDERERDTIIEQNRIIAIERINEIIIRLNTLDLDKKIMLKQAFKKHEINIITSFDRELAYSLEHSIHHFAIIKIALNQHFDYVKYPSHFGIAFSTLAYFKNRNE